MSSENLDSKIAAVAQVMKNIYQEEFRNVYKRIKAISDATDEIVGQNENHMKERARGVKMALHSHTGELNARMDDLKKRIDERVAKLEERIDKLADRLDLWERLEKLLDSKEKTT